MPVPTAAATTSSDGGPNSGMIGIGFRRVRAEELDVEPMPQYGTSVEIAALIGGTGRRYLDLEAASLKQHCEATA
jgi:hypothetical protein